MTPKSAFAVWATEAPSNARVPESPGAFMTGIAPDSVGALRSSSALHLVAHVARVARVHRREALDMTAGGLLPDSAGCIGRAARDALLARFGGALSPGGGMVRARTTVPSARSRRRSCGSGARGDRGRPRRDDEPRGRRGIDEELRGRPARAEQLAHVARPRPTGTRSPARTSPRPTTMLACASVRESVSGSGAIASMRCAQRRRPRSPPRARARASAARR